MQITHTVNGVTFSYNTDEPTIAIIEFTPSLVVAEDTAEVTALKNLSRRVNFPEFQELATVLNIIGQYLGQAYEKAHGQPRVNNPNDISQFSRQPRHQ